MQRLSSIVLSRLALRQQPPSEHPDADRLLGFVERSLPSRDRESVLSHLSRCPACREVVALIAPSPSTDLLSAPRGPTLERRWQIASAAAVAFLLAVIFSVPVLRLGRLPAVPVSPLSKASLPAVQIASPSLDLALNLGAQPPHRSASKVSQSKPRRLRSIPANAEPQPSPGDADRLEKAPLEPAPLNQAVQRQSFVAGSVVQPELRSARAPTALTLPASRQRSLWSLNNSTGTADPAGDLWKSNDGGKTWQAVHVAPRVPLYALSSSGFEIWAGGFAGQLFRSTDNGAHWTRVIVAHDGVSLTDTITALRRDAGNFVELQTQSGTRWVSADAGSHWQPQ